MKTITLSSGKDLTVLPLSPLLMQRINDSLPPRPTPPTYEADTAGGGVEVMTHDETTLQTEEEKTAWAEYQGRLASWSAEQSKRFLRVFFARGVHLNLDAAALDRWAKEMKYLGVNVPEGNPDDPEVYIERKVLYVETELIGSGGDMLTIMQEIMKLTGVDEGEVAAATRLFHSAVEGANNNSGNAG